jgi:hypothetical protein
MKNPEKFNAFDGKLFIVRAEDLLTALILPFAYLGALP